jgi:hypothetical protein
MKIFLQEYLKPLPLIYKKDVFKSNQQNQVWDILDEYDIVKIYNDIDQILLKPFLREHISFRKELQEKLMKLARKEDETTPLFNELERRFKDNSKWITLTPEQIKQEKDSLQEMEYQPTRE